MSTSMLWIIIGVLLILTELMATSIIAVFLGIGAIVTGILLYFGVIESFAAQSIVFGLVSLASLVVARKKFKSIFGGFTADTGGQRTQFQRDIGERVTVLADFEHGAGRVMLNGVAWNAVSDEDLKAGDVAWVTANEGINLTVNRKKP